ncbi:MAG: EF-P beta-lysylation protein EpmB [bacterium]|nr:EF-P beta-lysylation protein EpmB [bacterium]
MVQGSPSIVILSPVLTWFRLYEAIFVSPCSCFHHTGAARLPDVTDIVVEPWPSGEWRSLLADSVVSFDELLSEVGLCVQDLAGQTEILAATDQFPVRVPRTFISRMRRGDVNDPLLRQVLPTADEVSQIEGFTDDPLGESAARVLPGALQKYQGRMLMVATAACAVHCRYCFRRHFPFARDLWGPQQLDRLMTFLQTHSDISEVILSGGDPLALPDHQLAKMASMLAEVGSVARLRLHTRLPVAIPQRVDRDLVAWMSRVPLKVIVVLHANHPNELDGDVERAASVLRSTGALILNQSVLLAGVNDNAPTLAELSHRLVDIGVLPYYLHLLDHVQGAAGFDVGDDRARELLTQLREMLPGYMVPEMVRESAGAAFKTPFGEEAGPSGW